MEFIYAAELKQQFQVCGYFYYLSLPCGDVLCRSSADIFSKEIIPLSFGAPAMSDATPDAVGILMNPGGANWLADQLKSDNEIPHWKSGDASVTAIKSLWLKTDNTQYQLMRLMKAMGWKHLRLVNLSDICIADSTAFAHQFRKLAAANVENAACDADEAEMHRPSHSILAPHRRAEFDQLTEAGVVFAAWGSNGVLKSLAEECLVRFPDIQGLALERPWFRFASPYRKDQKMSWLEGMVAQLKA